MWKPDFNCLGDTYDWVEFSLPSGSSDYNVLVNQSGLFNRVPFAGIVVIETSVNITVKFNNTGNQAVKLDAGASPMELVKKMNIRNIFLTNISGTTANIRIWLFV
jgi:hypothetical protein